MGIPAPTPPAPPPDGKPIRPSTGMGLIGRTGNQTGQWPIVKPQPAENQFWLAMIVLWLAMIAAWLM